MFICVYYGHLSLVDAYNMPIHRRKWWIKRINEVIEKQNQQQNEVARMPAPQDPNQPNPMRARNVGR